MGTHDPYTVGVSLLVAFLQLVCAGIVVRHRARALLSLRPWHAEENRRQPQQQPLFSIADIGEGEEDEEEGEDLVHVNLCANNDDDETEHATRAAAAGVAVAQALRVVGLDTVASLASLVWVCSSTPLLSGASTQMACDAVHLLVYNYATSWLCATALLRALVLGFRREVSASARHGALVLAAATACTGGLQLVLYVAWRLEKPLYDEELCLSVREAEGGIDAQHAFVLSSSSALYLATCGLLALGRRRNPGERPWLRCRACAAHVLVAGSACALTVFVRSGRAFILEAGGAVSGVLLHPAILVQVAAAIATSYAARREREPESWLADDLPWCQIQVAAPLSGVSLSSSTLAAHDKNATGSPLAGDAALSAGADGESDLPPTVLDEQSEVAPCRREWVVATAPPVWCEEGHHLSAREPLSSDPPFYILQRSEGVQDLFYLIPALASILDVLARRRWFMAYRSFCVVARVRESLDLLLEMAIFEFVHETSSAPRTDPPPPPPLCSCTRRKCMIALLTPYVANTSRDEVLGAPAMAEKLRCCLDKAVRGKNAESAWHAIFVDLLALHDGELLRRFTNSRNYFLALSTTTEPLWSPSTSLPVPAPVPARAEARPEVTDIDLPRARIGFGTAFFRDVGARHVSAQHGRTRLEDVFMCVVPEEHISCKLYAM